jgi:hypothetical protein
MTKFENEINKGKMSTRVINCIIFDLNNNTTFDAWINTKTLQEIDSKMLKGYELLKLDTLKNYFNSAVVDKWEIEIKNSQYIYFSDFDRLYEYRFDMYIKALQDDKLNICNRLDRKYQK